MQAGLQRLCLVSSSVRCSASMSTTAAPRRKVLTYDTINPNVKSMEYAVRGPIVIRAVELEKELAAGKPLPFPNVIKANIGDAHAMGQCPVTFIRQTLACVSHPELMADPKLPTDVKSHAQAILDACGGKSAGAYSQSTGIDLIRKHVANFIQERDGGVPSNPEDICLSGGASESIRNVLKLFIRRDKHEKAGIMIPIPQYPLYSASLEEFHLGQVGYYLNEEKGWSLDVDELERALQANTDEFHVQALVVINPGNPTGQVLTKDNIEQIIKFAYEHKLFIFADEVYQENVYAEGAKFHSFKKVLFEMGDPYKSHVELASFYSVSKGYMGECGMRGGYVEFVNLDHEVYVQFKKMISAKLCSSILGQAVVDTVVNHPKPGEPSYEQWIKEKTAVLKSLKERATMVSEAYHKIPAISCNEVAGAMYAFPKVCLPQKAVAKAQELGVQPDFFYCKELLESTGICVVPGSGFGQRKNTYHFRTTILPQNDLTKEMLDRFSKFHLKFIEEYK